MIDLRHFIRRTTLFTSFQISEFRQNSSHDSLSEYRQKVRVKDIPWFDYRQPTNKYFSICYTSSIRLPNIFSVLQYILCSWCTGTHTTLKRLNFEIYKQTETLWFPTCSYKVPNIFLEKIDTCITFMAGRIVGLHSNDLVQKAQVTFTQSIPLKPLSVTTHSFVMIKTFRAKN